MIIKNMDNKRDIAFWVMVFVVILLCIYILFFIRTESYQCMSNPLVYGVGQYQSDTGYFTCSCSSEFTESILVTKDGISSLQNYNTLAIENS